MFKHFNATQVGLAREMWFRGGKDAIFCSPSWDHDQRSWRSERRVGRRCHFLETRVYAHLQVSAQGTSLAIRKTGRFPVAARTESTASHIGGGCYNHSATAAVISKKEKNKRRQEMKDRGVSIISQVMFIHSWCCNLLLVSSRFSLPNLSCTKMPIQVQREQKLRGTQRFKAMRNRSTGNATRAV